MAAVSSMQGPSCPTVSWLWLSTVRSRKWLRPGCVLRAETKKGMHAPKEDTPGPEAPPSLSAGSSEMWVPSCSPEARGKGRGARGAHWCTCMCVCCGIPRACLKNELRYRDRKRKLVPWGRMGRAHDREKRVQSLALASLWPHAELGQWPQCGWQQGEAAAGVRGGCSLRVGPGLRLPTWPGTSEQLLRSWRLP